MVLETTVLNQLHHGGGIWWVEVILCIPCIDEDLSFIVLLEVGAGEDFLDCDPEFLICHECLFLRRIGSPCGI